MSNSRIVVTQPGYDYRYCADYNFVFNSDWPSLQIAFEANATVTTGTSVTIKHGLGFYPLTMGWTILNGISIGRTFATSGTLFGPSNDVVMSFDKTNIYLTNQGNFNSTYQVSIKCYNIDISVGVDYTLPTAPAVKQAYDPTFGIKVTKFGKSMGSTDLRDYILNSRAQSPAILSIVTKPTLNVQGFPILGYTNPANYTPWAFAFYGGPGLGQTYKPIAPGAQQSGYQFGLLDKSQTNPNSFGGYQTFLSSFGTTAGDLTSYGTIVVLRDPLVVPNKVQVTY